LAAKHFIDTGAGVIDADYRGEVKVLLFNHSEVDFEGEFSYGKGTDVLDRDYGVVYGAIVNIIYTDVLIGLQLRKETAWHSLFSKG
jgi:hypothetical protein